MHFDPALLVAVACAFVILCVGFVLRRYRQPSIVAYLLAGVIVGPYGLALFTDVQAATRVGELGVVLLLFFVGMEISVPKLVANWRIAVLGTLAQITLTAAAVIGLGYALDWPMARSVLVGFVLSLSSTAAVVSILRQRGLLDSPIGSDTMGVLLVQDLAVVPMLLVVSYLSDAPRASGGIALQVLGSLVIVAVVVVVVKKGHIAMPFADKFRDDPELQVFGAFIVCFGFATFTGVCHLSTALGAFVAGIVVGATDETDWIHRSLEPLRVLLVALFFVAVGMLLVPTFLRENAPLLLGLVGAVLVGNTILNAGVLHALGREWGVSLRVGALLAPVGEFSFVLAALGIQAGLVSDFGYQLSVALIALTLMLSPIWSTIVDRVSGDHDLAPT